MRADLDTTASTKHELARLRVLRVAGTFLLVLDERVGDLSLTESK
ncbi:cephalosporin hydroxylase [Silvibacterium bohemicum]|uniref:Cephalosporin hydroxylase n=1 Tax=Silvibacterium bohemicum TaxID=1577686 RepID=A0A841JV09_9BACT|nr:cephalosporin hydroxylase [Silvibacterium bohemicum]